MARGGRSDTWIDGWLFTKGQPLKELVAAVTQSVEKYEKDARDDVNRKAAETPEGQPAPKMKRARKGADKETFSQSVELVTCNLVYATLTDGFRGSISYSRRKARKASRYTNKLLHSKTFRAVVTTMEGIGLLTHTTGVVNEYQSTFGPTETFKSEVEAYQVSIDDIGHDDTLDECIILKRKSDHLRQHDNGTWFVGKSAERVEYKDDAETIRLRTEVTNINTYLGQADLSFLPDGESPSVNTRDRRVRRFFALAGSKHHRFDLGGRLFGGWWMNLQRHRREGIRIDGAECRLLDFNNMFCRLAYARKGIQAPADDLYDLTGYHKGFDVGVHRAGVKTAFNSLIFGGERLTGEAKAHLPPKATMGTVKDALALRHPSLADDLGKVIGYELMMKESTMLVSILLTLQREDIVALPIHDGIVVKGDMAERAKSVMEEVGNELYGVHIPVSVKSVSG